LWEERGFGWNPLWQVPHLAVAGLKRHAGEIADHVYGGPSHRMWMVGVTGTNGKTSCSQWVAQCLTKLGRKTAVVGTLGSGFPGALEGTANTTPDAVVLHDRLKQFLADGAQAVAMEVSSHGLEQGRVNGVAFDIALLTNLTRDHLDYHGDMASYGAAKAKLFQWPDLKYAIFNLDDEFGAGMIEQCEAGACIGYGFRATRTGKWLMLRGENLSLDESGLAFDVHTPWGTARVESALLGEFNAANLLAVLATLLASDVNLADAVAVLAELQPVPGRMQRLGGGGQPLVVVDYAHTQDALEKVLSALRALLPEQSRLICVFGCGGDRDRGKRPLMGEVATRLAHDTIITSDNPRGENPQAIIADITEGAHANYRVEEDRAAAIFQAVHEARPGDVVLLAGKGHEVYQEIGGARFPFSDLDVARLALESWGEGRH
jgi:UDP-N-acetylmuramoyl-L-alanyl-D-glutamate--2,6-diaminopimelate ligase